LLKNHGHAFASSPRNGAGASADEPRSSSPVDLFVPLDLALGSLSRFVVTRSFRVLQRPSWHQGLSRQPRLEPLFAVRGLPLLAWASVLRRNRHGRH
jgi:hypothetical protein